MSTKIQAVLNAWKDYDLNSTQQQLDEDAAEITQNQDESDASRKKLVDQLKEFKKMSSEDIRKEASPIIKSFQNEVDFLSKRSKHAEIAFLKLYQKFLDIVDPVSSLEYSLSIEKKLCTQTDLEIENKTMRETLMEYNEELKEVRNQEITIKNLKEKLRKYKENMDTDINIKVKEAEQKLITLYTEKKQLLFENHQHSLQKLKESEQKYQVLQKLFEHSQSELFEVKNKLEEAVEAKGREIDILINDLDRTNQHAVSAQNELSQLKEQQSKTKTSLILPTEDIPISSIELLSLQSELLNKEKEISLLISDIKHLQSTLADTKGTALRQITRLEEEINSNKKIIANFEEKLQNQEDYEDIKRELTIIKSVEFESIDNLNSKQSANSVISKPLELLLLEKNKTLQNENTSLKLSNEALNSKVSELENENMGLKTLVSEQRGLISQLETDLISIPLGSNSREGSVSQIDFISDALRDVGQSDDGAVTQSYSKSSDAENTPSTTETLLSIVSAQRERFRYRNEELEADVSAKGSQILLLQNELDSLRGDNLRLYEKIRFLQSYQSNIKLGGDNLTESRYNNQYEKSLDPFMKFSLSEKRRRYALLSPFEKLTLGLGKFVLRSKTARTATFIYLSILHCLVFAVLYKLAFAESWKRDFSSDCAKKFAEHMYSVHGEG